MNQLLALCLTGLFLFHFQPQAQAFSPPPVKGLKQVFTLVMMSKSGNNGVAIAYHPKLKYYYAIYGGNENYPIEVFNKEGQPLHQETAKFDARGLWYNSSSKRLEGNSYGGEGLYSFSVDREGLPSVRVNESFGQPNEQSAGVFDGKKQVIYYDNQAEQFLFYSRESGREGRRLNLEATKPRVYNIRLGYTGLKGRELALLAPVERQIVLFDLKTGAEAEVLQLPASAPVEEVFNFDCANGMYWLFDRERKIWFGYQ